MEERLSCSERMTTEKRNISVLSSTVTIEVRKDTHSIAMGAGVEWWRVERDCTAINSISIMCANIRNPPNQHCIGHLHAIMSCCRISIMPMNIPNQYSLMIYTWSLSCCRRTSSILTPYCMRFNCLHRRMTRVLVLNVSCYLSCLPLRM